jgi:hypothetical protein
MRPIMGGVWQFGFYGQGCATICEYCDGGALINESWAMWMELEQLEAGSFRRRTSMAEHEAGMHWGINCWCMFPQAEPPS